MEKVIIIGGGPAGCTAAIYAARANLNPLVIESSSSSGGQLMTTNDVFNFPGFPKGISGPELVMSIKKQAEEFGARFTFGHVSKLEVSDKMVLHCGEKLIESKSIIVASGAFAKKLDVPGVDEFWQKGISTCAVCDGAIPMFRGKHIVVIGGGDSAMEEAIFLTKFASNVTIIHRREEFRASKYMVDKALSNPKINVIWNSVLIEVYGEEFLSGILIKNIINGKIIRIAIGGLFFAIGHSPNTDFLKGILDLDSNGYISVKPGTSITTCDGIFAAGDVCDPRYRQAITAAGSGCMAALDCEQWLSKATFLK